MTGMQNFSQQSSKQIPPAVIATGIATKGRLPAASGVTPMPGAAEAMQRIGHPVQVPRGRTVVQTGDANDTVFKVVEGVLRVVRILSDGRRYIVSFLKPGDFYGYSEPDEHQCSVEAVTDCNLVRYSRRDFDAMLEADASASRLLLRLLCHQLGANNRMLLLLGRKTAPERLASFLVSFIAPTSSEPDGRKQVFLPMSRSDIADHLGLTIETVSRLITKFRKARWISLLDAHTVLITAPDVLAELAAD